MHFFVLRGKDFWYGGVCVSNFGPFLYGCQILAIFVYKGGGSYLDHFCMSGSKQKKMVYLDLENVI